MTTAEAFFHPAPPPLPQQGQFASSALVHFLGSEHAYWQLRIKGAAFVLLTLGLYRFWLATDVRRFLWSNTEIAGDTLEYNGRATELLIGFLLAVAILVPLYMAFAVAALEIGALMMTAGVIGLPLVALLAEYALYRARHYRLTRTVFRGVRFDQQGSAWRYAFFALAWWSLVILTLGLAYPAAQASLQRFKMRNTSYGDLPGRFEGSGWSLFWRTLPLWFLVAAPLLGTVAVAIGIVDWNALSATIAQNDEDLVKRLQASPQFTTAIGFAVLAAGASVLFAISVYPLFQAMTLRWWLSGLRFGKVVVSSRLRVGELYRVYLRFVLYLLLFALAATVVGLVCLGIIGTLVGAGRNPSAAAEVIATVLLVGFYVAVALAVSTIYQVVVTASIWRLGAQTAELAGAEALESVRAAGAPSSALGEGLANALRVGGI